ncbi:MAG: heat-inducible transcriptional repressor HrcA [Nitrospirota bacterium]|nr:heat-inducible transcriptional repressor HrcA [Nitrospirota bacterium]
MAGDVLEERGRKVLEAVVSSYIKTGEPVGSRTITKKFGMGLSPATIRNIMADLEDLQLLTHPHTSAGRIPTDLGYRYYVDTLMEAEPQDKLEREIGERLKRHDADIKNLLTETSKMLSSLTHYAGLVMAAKIPETLIRRVQFIRLNEKRVLVILVTANGMIQNKFIDVERDLSQSDLDQLASRLNGQLEEMNLGELRKRLVEEMQGTRKDYASMLEKVFSQDNDRPVAERGDSLFLGGLSEMMAYPEYANNIEKLKTLYHAFEEKYHLIKLLDSSLEAGGVQIFIGTENPYFEMQDCSVVTASYGSHGRIVGALGVIGPTRMDYNRVIPVVNCTAKLLSRVMERSESIPVR